MSQLQGNTTAKTKSWGPKAPQTCDTCKFRHQKCCGTRPSCNHCATRGIRCEYSHTKAHQVDRTSVRRQNPTPDVQGELNFPTNLATAANEYTVVYDILVAGLSNSGLTPEQRFDLSTSLANNIAQSRTSQPIPTHFSPTAKSQNTGLTSAQQLVQMLTQICTGKIDQESIEVLQGGFPSEDDTFGSPLSPSTDLRMSLTHRRELLPSKSQAEKWLRTYLCGPNTLMSICSPSESFHLLNALYDRYASLNEQSECLITWQLAVGSRLAAGTDERLYTAIYESALILTEKCIEEGDSMLLWIVPTLLLRCNHQISARPRKCWLLLGLAIRIAQTHGIDLPNKHCPELSVSEYSQWREVWRAILILDTFLSIILGRPAQVNRNNSHDPFIKDIRNELCQPSFKLEVNMAKLAVVIGEFLQKLYSSTQVELGDYEKYLQYLHEFSSSLPPCLKHNPGSTTPSTFSVEDQLASLNLDVFYFASVMIVTLPTLVQIITIQMGEEETSIPFQMRLLAQTCVDSAIQVAHVSTKLMRRGFICQRSWLITTLTHYASLVLLLSLSMTVSNPRWDLTSAQEAARKDAKSSALGLSADVLSFCAEQDSLSARFLKIGSLFRNAIDPIKVSQALRPHELPSGCTNPESAASTSSSFSRPGPSSMEKSPMSNFGSLSTDSSSMGTMDAGMSQFLFQPNSYYSKSSFSDSSAFTTQNGANRQLVRPLSESELYQDSHQMAPEWNELGSFLPDAPVDFGTDFGPRAVNETSRHYDPSAHDLRYPGDTGL